MFDENDIELDRRVAGAVVDTILLFFILWWFAYVLSIY